MAHPIDVPTCIACGARFRAGACEDGCDDVPIDLVELDDVAAVVRAVEEWRARCRAMGAVLEEVAGGATIDDAVRTRARAALRPGLPARPRPEVVEAWGCLRCGRVDAPAPCLGLCTRTPVAMVTADALDPATRDLDAAENAGRRMAAVLRQVAGVRARSGHEEATAAALRAAARRATSIP